MAFLADLCIDLLVKLKHLAITDIFLI